MTTLLKGFGYSFALVPILFAGMMVPGIGEVAAWLLGPGYALPDAYWGAVHDPLQLLAAFILNVLFYGVVLSIGLWLLNQKNAAIPR